jgi:hypothetical protein
MPFEDKDLLNTKIDVGVLKEQAATLTMLCTKMDSVIQKLVDQHDLHITNIYNDMEKRRLETEADVKEIHDRIDTVLDKVQITELRLLDEIKEFRKELGEHTKNSQEQFEKLNSWKWMFAGGILAISWLISHFNIDTIFDRTLK